MESKTKPKHVVVIVLGDIGRSPRMQYHALSLLENGHQVSLIGYSGEELIPQLIDVKFHDYIHIIRFKPYSPPNSLRKIFLPMYLALRLFGITIGLIFALCQVDSTKSGSVDCVLVQNPPSAPILLISYLYTLTKPNRPRLVIDWHNLGFTMFQMREGHPIRKMAKSYEKFMASKAAGHVCVTKAMKIWLIENFGIQSHQIEELYDRPPDFFRPTSLEEMHELMMKLGPYFEEKCPELSTIRALDRDSTLFTKYIDSELVMRKDRPALVISSTSWTADEDFSILLDALVKMDIIAERDKDLPHTVVIVTGKGPQKVMYEAMMKSLNLLHISILTLWLESQDYPKLLGCADLGISLHTSTSGLDLPMKVLDMYGCEVPVCAINFACLDELVQDHHNGRVFLSSDDLCSQLVTLLKPKRCQKNGKIGGDLQNFRNNIRCISRWRENWLLTANDIILCTNENTPSSKRD